jgi:hypothetical protein
LAERQRKEQERAEQIAAQTQALAAETAARCGKAPLQSAWNGSYHYVESYLKENANDPDAIDVASCSKAVLTTACWKTVCKFRGKNLFGGKVLTFGVFYIAEDKALGSWRVVSAE